MLHGSVPWWKELTAPTEKFALAAGYNHTLAMVEGQLWTWEYKNKSELGIGSMVEHWPPVKVAGVGKSFAAIAAGFHHNVALTDSGHVWTWGDNEYGQLGIGNANNQVNPVKVAVGKSFVAIAAGCRHTVALAGGGEVWTWGYNDYGQLGTGTTTHQPHPVQVTAGKSFVAIAAGWHHSLALSGSGELMAWGYNDHGQLGIDNKNYQLNLVQMSVGKELQFPNHFFLSAWSDGLGARTACDVSSGSAFPCISAFLKARSCGDSGGCNVFVGAKAAEPCDAGTFCPAGKGFAIPCPEGHFCTLPKIWISILLHAGIFLIQYKLYNWHFSSPPLCTTS